MPHPCTPEEQSLISAFQDDVKAMKRAARSARANMKSLYKINEEAGRFDEAADINRVKAAATEVLAAADNLDAVGGKAAVACYTDPGPIILGGGR